MPWRRRASKDAGQRDKGEKQGRATDEGQQAAAAPAWAPVARKYDVLDEGKHQAMLSRPVVATQLELQQ
jgi:hypothetical protein